MLRAGRPVGLQTLPGHPPPADLKSLANGLEDMDRDRLVRNYRKQPF